MSSPPLRIVQIVPYYAPAWAYGGSTRVVYELTRRLAARGHMLTVCTTDALDSHGRLPAGEHQVEGITVMRVANLSNDLAWRRLFIPPGFGAEARRALHGADVAHLHEVRSLLNAQALPALRREGVPYIITPHGGLPIELNRPGAKRLYDALVGRRLLAGACRLHALTGMERDQALAMGVPAERIALIPNGIDFGIAEAAADVPRFKRRYDVLEGAPVVAYLGRLNAIKGVDVLVEAFPAVLNACPDAVLVIAGPDDGLRPALEAQVDRLGIRDAVRFTGMLESERVKAAAYRAADAYVLPSRYENQPTTVLEALLCEAPCVVSDRAGLSHQLAAADVATVAPGEDAPALAAAIAGVLHHPQEARERARRGRDYVRREFDWEAVVDRWEAVYRACAGSK